MPVGEGAYVWSKNRSMAWLGLVRAPWCGHLQFVSNLAFSSFCFAEDYFYQDFTCYTLSGFNVMQSFF